MFNIFIIVSLILNFIQPMSGSQITNTPENVIISGSNKNINITWFERNNRTVTIVIRFKSRMYEDNTIVSIIATNTYDENLRKVVDLEGTQDDIYYLMQYEITEETKLSYIRTNGPYKYTKYKQYIPTIYT